MQIGNKHHSMPQMTKFTFAQIDKFRVAQIDVKLNKIFRARRQTYHQLVTVN